MPTELDLSRWPRREAYEFFRGFDKPYFNVCTRVDAAPLKALALQRQRDEGVGRFWLAFNFVALRLANACEPFRYRLHDGRVSVYEAVHGRTTVLRDDDSFRFATLVHQRDYAGFARQAAASVADARSGRAPFAPLVDERALIHLTTLPWLHFSSFSHARNWGREDSVPKISFGRADADADGKRLWLPLSVEVHHALMDGVHVGRYVQAFEAALADPAPWLA